MIRLQRPSKARLRWMWPGHVASLYVLYMAGWIYTVLGDASPALGGLCFLAACTTLWGRRRERGAFHDGWHSGVAEAAVSEHIRRQSQTSPLMMRALVTPETPREPWEQEELAHLLSKHSVEMGVARMHLPDKTYRGEGQDEQRWYGVCTCEAIVGPSPSKRSARKRLIAHCRAKLAEAEDNS